MLKTSDTILHRKGTTYLVADSNGDLTKIQPSGNRLIYPKKSNERIKYTDTTSSTIILSIVLGNYDYQFGTISTLRIQSVASSEYQSNIYFTAGALISVYFPADVQFIGEATFEANKKYVISILNRIAVVGKIGD